MKKFALLGHNIDYSLSPIIHNHIYNELGVKASYELVSSTVDGLDETIKKLKAYDGFNVTKPHKNTIIKYLDTNNTEFDAVNTVVSNNGKLGGYNTDYYGFITHIKSNINLDGKKVLVLGAGGVANVVVKSLIDNSAYVHIYNRTHQNAINLANKYGASAVNNYNDNYDIIVNCTSLGLNAGENPCVDKDLSKVELVYDTIYLDTQLLQNAKNSKVKTLDGLDMLILQAIKADEIFFNTEINDKQRLVEEIRKTIKSSGKL